MQINELSIKKNIPVETREFENVCTIDDLDLRGESLSDRDFKNADLSGANLAGVDLSGADLTNARLFRADLSNARLRDATLDGAELAGASLTKADMINISANNASFGMANLEKANLLNARLENATLSLANLNGADLKTASLKGARLREAKLQGADFTNACLKDANISLCDVRGACFNNADLRGTRLRDLKGVDQAHWIGVDIRDINFSGAYLMRRFIIDQNFLHEFRRQNKLTAVLYNIWWVTSDCGRSITRWCFFTFLLALLFGLIYSFVGINYGEFRTWFSPFYYSVVTLTGLGYGDIVPGSTASQIIAMMEVLTGYVMLGGLLSIFANKMARRAD